MLEHNLMNGSSLLQIEKYNLEDLETDFILFKKSHSSIESSKPIILKNFISDYEANEAKKEITNFISKNNFYKNYFSFNENFVTVNRGISQIQKTLHYYKSVNFNILDLENNSITNTINIFHKLLNFYNFFLNLNLTFHNIYNKHKLIPQCMLFMKGGGFLAKHIHKYLPQKIGLILNLSNTIKDNIDCSIQFDRNNEIINTYDHFMQGDLLVFNYKQSHWVTPCNINEPSDHLKNQGLFILTLPLIEITK